MEEPPKIQPWDLADDLELLTRAVFPAGLSWRLGERMWERFRDAFCRFDPPTVAGFDHADYFFWVVNESVPADEDWCGRRGLEPQT